MRYCYKSVISFPHPSVSSAVYTQNIKYFQPRRELETDGRRLTKMRDRNICNSKRCKTGQEYITYHITNTATLNPQNVWSESLSRQLQAIRIGAEFEISILHILQENQIALSNTSTIIDRLTGVPKFSMAFINAQL